jgi:thiamine transport system substrate-binding protein
MKLLAYCLFLIFTFEAVSNPPLKKVRPLVVYTYDTLADKNSVGALLKLKYEKIYSDRKVELVSFTSAGEAVTQMILEGKNTRADVIFGLDNSLLSKLMATNLLKELPTDVLSKVPKNLVTSAPSQVVPFDFGYLAFIYDSQKTKLSKNRISLIEFATAPQFAKKVIIQDPRTSSIGSSFLSYTRAVLNNDQWPKFWTAMQNQLERITPSWSTAYGLFLDGRCDFVLSYTTSPAYHLAKEGKKNYRALLFDEGQFQQWEGAAVLAKSPKASEALDFIRLLLSDEVQKEIPSKNWMLPVVRSSPLPPAFLDLALPTKVISVTVESERERVQTLHEWVNLLSR